MQNQSNQSVMRLVIVIATMAFFVLLAGSGVVWAAPPSQGTVPPPPPPKEATPVPPPPPPGLPSCCLPGIAFSSMRDGNEEIYLMRYDGTGLTRLTNLAAVDREPAPSPDGLRIAFVSSRDDPDPQNCGKDGKPNCIYHIYVMNVDGSNVTRLTNTPAQDTMPTWSNGGIALAFVSNRDDPAPTTCGQTGKPACITHIYLMNVDGSGQTRLTSNPVATPNAANWDPNFAPDDTKIAFVSNRDGNSEIYVVNIDGGNLTRLTTNPTSDAHPAWSPDGKMLAFETNREGAYRIFTMNANGSNQLRITSVAGEDRHPIWLPGCAERIVFASNREGGAFRIFAVDPDGANITRLTSAPTGAAATAPDDFPAWSGLPEALRVPGPCCVPGVTFDSIRDGNPEIYIMRDDGARLTRLTVNGAKDMNPAPSPDGTRIAFQSNRDGRFQIYVMNVDGGGLTRLTNNNSDDTEPIWSNNRANIAFTSNRDDPNPATCGASGKPCVTHIYVMSETGGGARRVTSNPDSNVSAVNSGAVWSPDNKKLAFVSNRDGNDEIYVINVDGSGLTRLTNNAASDTSPSFSPDGTRLVFESNRDGRPQLYTMKSDGTDVKRLTTSNGDDRKPYWCPSCVERIVFSSNRDGVNLVYAINADGTGLARLTSPLPNVAWNDDNPAWSGLPVRLPIPVPMIKLGASR